MRVNYRELLYLQILGREKFISNEITQKNKKI